MKIAASATLNSRWNSAVILAASGCEPRLLLKSNAKIFRKIPMGNRSAIPMRGLVKWALAPTPLALARSTLVVRIWPQF